MNESSNYIRELDILISILIRCFVIGVVFVMSCFIFFLLSGDAGYRIHAITTANKYSHIGDFVI
jgi:hypothetical protein